MTPPSLQRCASCGGDIAADAARCPVCGVPTPSGARAGGTAADDAAYRERLARSIGADYALGSMLGRGGFAEVYAADDQQLKRPVAVKVLRRDLTLDATVHHRFRREVR